MFVFSVGGACVLEIKEPLLWIYEMIFHAVSEWKHLQSVKSE